MTLEFDAATHTYRFDGCEVPSVSRIIRDLSMADLRMVPPDVLKAAGEFGTRVHALTERYDREGGVWHPLYWDLPESEQGCLAAWDNFRREQQFYPLLIEERVYHPRLRYAGTVDRVGSINDADGRPRRALIDIKTSEPHDWHGVQLKGYELALLPDWSVERNLAVYLRPDGTYRVREYPGSAYIHKWIAQFKRFQQEQQS